MKFCKNCAHFRPARYHLSFAGGGYFSPKEDECRSPKIAPDPVYGTKAAEAMQMRQEQGGCGPSGEWFEGLCVKRDEA